MYQKALLVLFISFISFVSFFYMFAKSSLAEPLSRTDPLTKKEFEQLQSDIRQAYARAPHTALKQVEGILEKVALEPKHYIAFLNYKAWFQLDTNQLSEAMRTLVLYKSKADSPEFPGLMYGYYNISGGIYIQLNLHQQALESLLAALEQAKILNKSLINQTLNNIGNVYLALNRLDEAEKVFTDYSEYAVSVNQPLSEVIAKRNLAETLFLKHEHQKAEQLLIELITLQKEHNFNRYLAKSYLLLGQVKQVKKAYALAINYYGQSLELLTKLNIPDEIIEVYFNLAKNYADMGDDEQAQLYIDKVAAQINSDTNLVFVSEFYQFKSTYLEAKGHYKKAINAYKKHNDAQAQLIKRQGDVNLAKAIAEIDLKVKEAEIAVLTREAQLKEAKAKAFQNLSLAIATSLLVFLLGGYFAIVSIHKKNKRLADALSKLEKTQKHLIEAEKVASLTVLVSGMAHQLNTPIGTIVTANSILEDNLQSVSQQFSDKKLSAASFSQFIESSHSANQLISSNTQRLDQMVNEFKALNVSIEADKPLSELSLQAFLTERMTILQGYLAKKVSFQIQGDEATIVTAPTILGDVIKTLVINAYEHGFKDVEQAAIAIDIKRDLNTVTIAFQDNGSGIDSAILKDIFVPFYSTNIGGNHLGLGLNVVFNAVKYNLFGDIFAEPCQQGARFIITLPIDASSAAQQHRVETI
ncbi:tetratricopeptide repeat-containing sensor histidine kinase [Colwellia asteriadis]